MSKLDEFAEVVVPSVEHEAARDLLLAREDVWVIWCVPGTGCRSCRCGRASSTPALSRGPVPTTGWLRSQRFDLPGRQTGRTWRDGAGPVVLVSARIGVTPLLAILHGLRDSHSTRGIWWLHAARSSSEHAFAAEVRALLAELPGARSRIWYSRPGPDDLVGFAFDQRGHLSAEGIRASGAPLDAEFWICGPAPFMDEIHTGLGALGVPEARIHTEAFGAVSPITPGIIPQSSRPPHPPEGTAGTGPLVSFVRSGLNVRWPSESASILELAEACDVAVRWSCRTGVCHTCETGLLEGVVSYALEPLEPAAPGNVLVCCSRPGSDIAVDL